MPRAAFLLMVIPAGVMAGQPRPALPELLTEEEVARVVRDNKPAIDECIRLSQKKAPEKAGKVVLEWTVTPAGKVREVQLVSPEHAGTPFTACAMRQIETWKFPPHRKQGKPVQFPFLIPPAAAESDKQEADPHVPHDPGGALDDW